MKSLFLGGAIYGLWLFGTAHAFAETHGAIMAADLAAASTG
jgi:hypothetical protein